ncbi:MAG: methyl-accepting chemotaxis protein, partial [Alteromonadaceae bacterium]
MGVFNFLNNDELKAAQHEAQLKTQILDACTASIMVIDGAGNIVYHNPAFLALAKQCPDDFTVSTHGGHASLKGQNLSAVIKGNTQLLNQILQCREESLYAQLAESVFTLNITPLSASSSEPAQYVVQWSDNEQEDQHAGMVSAINQSQAVILFSPDGNIVKANENFLSAMGYSESEIEGKHHSLFVTREYASSQEYKDFWSVLRSGEAHSGEFCRVNNKGEDVWIQASYNPILDSNGQPFKVVKFATDITAEKAKNAYFEGQLTAI